jgi:hypothetical protein
MKFKAVAYSWTKARALKRVNFMKRVHPRKINKYHIKILPKYTTGKAHKKGYVIFAAKKR